MALFLQAHFCSVSSVIYRLVFWTCHLCWRHDRVLDVSGMDFNSCWLPIHTRYCCYIHIDRNFRNPNFSIRTEKDENDRIILSEKGMESHRRLVEWIKETERLETLSDINKRAHTYKIQRDACPSCSHTSFLFAMISLRMALPLRNANVNQTVALMINTDTTSTCELNVFGKGYISLIVFNGSKPLAKRYKKPINKRYQNQGVSLFLSVTTPHSL